MKETELKPCPFCKTNSVYIAVHDDEGNYKGRIGCEYEKDPWSGLSYALHHEGWGECILCTDGEEQTMGGVLFDTPEETAEEWNKGVAPKSGWISVENKLPDIDVPVLIFANGIINIATMEKGITEEEREKMRNGELPNPSTMYWCRSEGHRFVKRSEVYSGADVQGNNKVPYRWRAICSPIEWFGQEVTHWMPLPETPKGGAE